MSTYSFERRIEPVAHWLYTVRSDIVDVKFLVAGLLRTISKFLNHGWASSAMRVRAPAPNKTA